jgi:hypothetical protein
MLGAFGVSGVGARSMLPGLLHQEEQLVRFCIGLDCIRLVGGKWMGHCFFLRVRCAALPVLLVGGIGRDGIAAYLGLGELRRLPYCRC